MGTSYNSKIINDGLVLLLDAANPKSFPGLPTIQVLIVAGGGGGGTNIGGGGGGGGVIYKSAIGLSPNTNYSVVVGAGGAGAPAGLSNATHPTVPGSNGGNSSFNGLTALGGGWGGVSYLSMGMGIEHGNAGGSGGGCSGYNNGSYPNGTYGSGAGTIDQGFAGGTHGSPYYSGGGGGARAPGESGNNQANGGAGFQTSILGNSYYFGGGGGGAGHSRSGGAGGAGGGGGGGTYADPNPSTGLGDTNGVNPGSNGGGNTNGSGYQPGGNGGANTGGGGGAGTHYDRDNKGGDGGSGIVVIRYAGPQKATGGTVTTVGTDTVHMFTSNGTFCFNTNITGLTGNGGSLTYGASYIPAAGGMVLFDGVDDFISPDSVFNPGTADFTLSSWFYQHSNNSNAFISFASGSYAVGLFSKYSMGTGSHFGTGYGNQYSVMGADLALDTWYHLTGVREGTTLKIYVNGVLSNTVTGVPIQDMQPNYLQIGRMRAGQHHMDGKIAQTAIYNRALTASEVQQNYIALSGRFPAVGTSPSIGTAPSVAATSATAIITANPSAQDGVYWIKPTGQATAYPVYCKFNYMGNNWMAVSGLNAAGVRADANGNSSGLAGLLQAGENTDKATLSGNTHGNYLGYNFTLPRAWINACNPKALRVKSNSQDMFALFNRSGSYVTINDIWSYYYAMNNYDDVPVANGRNHSAATVMAWVNSYVTIYAGTTDTGVQGQLWSGNHHCGWSNISDTRHMLHGGTNLAWPGSYPGFCLGNTCWNESGTVWIAGT